MRKKRGVSVFFPVVQRKINIIMQLWLCYHTFLLADLVSKSFVKYAQQKWKKNTCLLLIKKLEKKNQRVVWKTRAVENIFLSKSWGTWSQWCAQSFGGGGLPMMLLPLGLQVPFSNLWNHTNRPVEFPSLQRHAVQPKLFKISRSPKLFKRK